MSEPDYDWHPFERAAERLKIEAVVTESADWYDVGVACSPANANGEPGEFGVKFYSSFYKHLQVTPAGTVELAVRKEFGPALQELANIIGDLLLQRVVREDCSCAPCPQHDKREQGGEK
jgi:hypothetical protein